jgi:hypothetical protein
MNVDQAGTKAGTFLFTGGGLSSFTVLPPSVLGHPRGPESKKEAGDGVLRNLPGLSKGRKVSSQVLRLRNTRIIAYPPSTEAARPEAGLYES